MKLVKWRNNWKINQFEKWESWNPYWRPKKTVNIINEELKKKGYPPVAFQHIVDCYLQIINLDIKELEELQKNAKNLPFLYRIVLKHLSNNKGFDVLEKMLDRALWKAKETIELKQELSEEDKKLIKQKLQDE